MIWKTRFPVQKSISIYEYKPKRRYKACKVIRSMKTPEQDDDYDIKHTM